MSGFVICPKCKEEYYRIYSCYVNAKNLEKKLCEECEEKDSYDFRVGLVLDIICHHFEGADMEAPEEEAKALFEALRRNDYLNL